MKEKFMFYLKYIPLFFVIFTGFVFSAEEKDGWRQRKTRLITQDCRETLLTPAEARNLAYRRSQYRFSKPVKFIKIREIDILNSSNLEKSALESIAKGANINASDKNGCTVLHFACAAQNINLALDLIRYGALLLRNSQNTFPQDLISSNKLNVDDTEVDFLRNLLIEEERQYVSKYKKMHEKKEVTINKRMHLAAFYPKQQNK